MAVIKKIDQVYSKYEMLLIYLGGFCCIACMLLTAVDVVLRNFFKASIPATTEIVAMLLLPIFLGAVSYLQGKKKHIIMEFATEKLPPIGRAILDLFGILLGLALFISILGPGFDAVVKAFTSNQVTAGIIDWPLWPFKLYLELIIVTMTIRLSLDTILMIDKIHSLHREKGGAEQSSEKEADA